MKLVRMTNYQAATLKGVVEGRAAKYTMDDLRHVHNAILAINAATKEYRDQAKEAADEIQKQLKEAEALDDPQERADRLAEARETDQETAKALREGAGAVEVEIGIEDSPFDVVLKQWRAMDGWNPAEEARTVVIAIDDALKAAKNGHYVDGQFIEETPSEPRPVDIAKQRARRRRR